jgi:hypothetical protein
LYEVDGGVVEISEEVRILRVDVERLFGLVDFLARLRTVLVQEVICTVARPSSFGCRGNSFLRFDTHKSHSIGRTSEPRELSG